MHSTCRFCAQTCKTVHAISSIAQCHVLALQGFRSHGRKFAALPGDCRMRSFSRDKSLPFPPTGSLHRQAGSGRILFRGTFLRMKTPLLRKREGHSFGGRGSKLPCRGGPLQILLKSCGFRPQNLQGYDFSRKKSAPMAAVHAADQDWNSSGPKPLVLSLRFSTVAPLQRKRDEQEETPVRRDIPSDRRDIPRDPTYQP